MKRLLVFTFACANLTLFAACGGGSSNNSTPPPATVSAATSAADLDAKVTALNNGCANQGLSQFSAPAGSREAAAKGALNGNYEFSDSKLMLVSANPDGTHAVVLVSTKSNGDGTYSNNTDCHDVYSAGDNAISLDGDLSSPLKTVGDGAGNSTSTGLITVTASKSKYSNDFEIRNDVDQTKVQKVTSDSYNTNTNPNILGKAYVTNDGVVIVARFNVNTSGSTLYGEYLLIHMKRVAP